MSQDTPKTKTINGKVIGCWYNGHKPHPTLSQHAPAVHFNYDGRRNVHLCEECRKRYDATICKNCGKRGHSDCFGVALRGRH